MEKVTLDHVIKFSLLKECIYIRKDFKGEWDLFISKFNEPFYSLEDAIYYFRDNRDLFKGHYIELSSFNQARLGNGEWDNI